MASRKQEIRKEIKKKNAKLGIDVEAAKNIVDLQDQQGEDIHVEDFKNEEYNGEVIPFSTTPQKTKKGFVSKIKGVFDDERKQLKKLDKIAQEIISLEDKYSALSDEELANQTNVLKEKLNNGSELDDILIDAFAVAREAAWRQIHLKAFKVQLMGGIALHNGDIAEMKTGEGKTLTSIFPVYLNALTGKGVHVITVNDYLAERDARNNGKVLEFLGLTVGLNKRELTPQQKQEAHGCDVTYTTNAELGFDYLRDNMVTSMEDKVLVKGLNYALIDEVDSILIDESRTPLIISGGKKNTAALYLQADRFVKSLIAEKDYEVDIETKTEELVLPIIEANNFELVDVEYVKEGANWYLRVYADKEGGIAIDDCVLISRSLEEKLDAEDFIEDAYILEVSSPGLGRPLKKEKDYVRSVGKSIDIKLYKAIDKQKEFTGILKENMEDQIVLTIEDQDITFEKKSIASARLSLDF